MTNRSQTTIISVDEYLHSGYEPDCDYVEGELVERSVGEKSHGKLQFAIATYYAKRIDVTGLHPFIEQRIRVSKTRYRVPDVCLTIGEPPEEIFTGPPLVAIEVLSPEDRMPRMQLKIDDYINFGVRYVWVIDPISRHADVFTAEGSYQVKDGILRTTNPDTELPLNEILGKIQTR